MKRLSRLSIVALFLSLILLVTITSSLHANLYCNATMTNICYRGCLSQDVQCHINRCGRTPSESDYNWCDAMCEIAMQDCLANCDYDYCIPVL